MGGNDPFVRPENPADEYTIIVASGRNFFYPMKVSGEGGRFLLKKKRFLVSM